MLRIILVTIILLSCSTKDSRKFSWGRMDTKISREEKRAVLSKIENAIIKSYDQQATELNDLGIYDLFHFVDINGDDKDDIIYNGYGGAADEFIMIYLNLDSAFLEVFYDYGHIDDLDINSSAVITITRKLMVGEEGRDSTFQYKLADNIIKRIR